MKQANPEAALMGCGFMLGRLVLVGGFALVVVLAVVLALSHT